MTTQTLVGAVVGLTLVRFARLVRRRRQRRRAPLERLGYMRGPNDAFSVTAREVARRRDTSSHPDHARSH